MQHEVEQHGNLMEKTMIGQHTFGYKLMIRHISNGRNLNFDNRIGLLRGDTKGQYVRTADIFIQKKMPIVGLVSELRAQQVLTVRP